MYLNARVLQLDQSPISSRDGSLHDALRRSLLRDNSRDPAQPMKLSRAVIFFGAFAVLVVLAVFFSAFLLPSLVDSRLIREKITSEFATKSAGRVAIGKISLVWLPRPSVLMEKLDIFFGDEIRGSIRNLQLYPDLFHLVRGRIVIRRALVEEPRMQISLPERAAGPFDSEKWEEQIRSALLHLTRQPALPQIELSGGYAEIRVNGRTPVVLENVEAQATATPGTIQFAIRARSSLCEQLRIAGAVAPSSLETQLDVGVQQLKIRETLAFAAPSIAGYAKQGAASLAVKIASLGLRRVKGSLDGSVADLVVALKNGAARLDAHRLKAGIAYEDGALQLDVAQLDFLSPRLTASGALKFQSGLISASVRARDFEIADISELALRIAGDDPRIRSVSRYIAAGTIVEMRLESAGKSFDEVVSRQNIAVSALIRGGRILIPRYDLEFKNVGGSVRIAHGLLDADHVTGNLGSAAGWNGKVTLGLHGKNAPFHLDIQARSAAPEVQALLLKIVSDEPLRRELSKLRDVSGELSGRLVLGDSLDAISPVVTTSKLAVSAIYSPVDFPIEIRAGRFSYDRSYIKLENAHGSLGRSIFDGLILSLSHDGSRRFSAGAARMSLDLEETESLLGAFKDLTTKFTALQSARGLLELEQLTLAGSYDDAAAWTFATSGRFHEVELTHPEFPGPFGLSRGKFTVNEREVEFSGTAIMLADASWVGGGMLEYSEEGWVLVGYGSGTAGAQMVQWLNRRLAFPEEIRIRSPLAIGAERIAWHSSGEFAFRGAVTPAGGPQIALEAVKSPGALAVPNLTVADGDRRARISFQSDEESFVFSFTGELAQPTIDKIFAAFPVADGAVMRGDIQVTSARQRPLRVSAQGYLDGAKLWLPLNGDRALLETFSIEARGDTLMVQSADLRWRGSRFMVSGRIAPAQEILQLAIDVTGDEINWDELQPLFARDKKQAQKNPRPFSAVQGTIRLKTDRFMFQGFEASRLETTVTLSGSEIRADIDHAIGCGINVAGLVDVIGNELRIDVRLTAVSSPLEPTTICLTNRQNEVTGSYSLTARLYGRGERDQLLSALQGTFELSASNGEFIRSPGIDATFDYLNESGDFKVAFPDLDRQTFPYRLISIKGRVEGETVIGDEVTVQSGRLNLSGHGRVDLKEKRVDAKALIAVLQPVDEVISHLPVISSLWGGSLVGIPVRVMGSLERPDVTYLSPRDVGAELLNIPIRILKIPVGAMRLFIPYGNSHDKKSGK